MVPKSGKGKAPPPPKSKAKPASKWSSAQKVKRADSGEIVQEWRKDGRPSSIEELDWSSLESYSYIGGGSGGVILLRFAGSPPRLCCLKPQRLDATAELCAICLAKALGIPTAQLKVIRKSDAVMEALKQAKPPIDEHAIHLEKKVLTGPCLAAVEFVNGPMMEGIEFVNALQSKSSEDLQKVWQEVGRLIAFDCLINNYDRLPMIWDNDGNPRNVMLDVDPNSFEIKVKGIDQAVRSITSQDGLKSYCEKLRRLVQVAMSDDIKLWTNGPFKRLESTIQQEFQGMLTADAFHLRLGLRNAFESFARSWESGQLQDDMVQCQAQVAEVFHDVGASNVGLDELENIATLIESTASVIAEEYQGGKRHIVPDKIVSCFQRAWPRGQLVHQQLLKLWQILDPDCTSDEMGAVFEAYLREERQDELHSDQIDWSNFLKWLYTQ